MTPVVQSSRCGIAPRHRHEARASHSNSRLTRPPTSAIVWRGDLAGPRDSGSGGRGVIWRPVRSGWLGIPSCRSRPIA